MTLPTLAKDSLDILSDDNLQHHHLSAEAVCVEEVWEYRDDIAFICGKGSTVLCNM